MHDIHIHLPPWLDPFLTAHETRTSDDARRMSLVLDLAHENVRLGTGGPFGAAVFETRSGRLVAAGVNLVVASHCSIAHAEMVAIASAQQRLGHYNLREAVPGGCVLFSSAEPCAMCLGAIPWSGIDRLVCAARDEDARAVGFDEGHKPQDWIAGYARRGILVTSDLMRLEAAGLLRDYADSGGEIYDPSGTDTFSDWNRTPPTK
ncbi:nucleoside deaminase [Thiocystis violacea]|uniref:nucleoside deaminase n=1 Tax=Thiocystis violacea TaxID=13725 RepID=UPI001903F917|nr:nucleoside deaminase [Thiocystis violacea]MBK1719789.1 tRNA-specific adenosine deaminase [Thiocystis violacea]